MKQSAASGARVLGVMLVFLSLTCVGSWLPTLLFQEVWRSGSPSAATDVLRCSLLYLALIGWQPFAAALLVRRFLEHERLNAGLRRSSQGFTLLAIVVPCAAMLVASILYLLIEPAPPGTTAALIQQPSVGQAAISMLAVFLAGVVVYGQCWLEEIAWRGYLLVRAMEYAGPWGGLLLHGAAWGGWYGSILVVLSGGDAGSWSRASAFVATCSLLGVALGWLRLAAGSIVPAVVANTVLTLGAGLPILLRGGNIGARSAIYLPIGWVPLLLLLLWLVGSPQRRRAVAIPRPPNAPRRLSTALH